MATLEPFLRKIKPALDTFLRAPSKNNLSVLEAELLKFDFALKIPLFQTQIIQPLFLKLDELNRFQDELRSGILRCIRITCSHVYLKDLNGLRAMLTIIINQLRSQDGAKTKANLSEELKLESVLCISEILKRSTSDVLELFYMTESNLLLGQILLTLIEFVEGEKYKHLVICSIESLMTVFYVHDDAEKLDLVLRDQVADTLFIYLPKVVSVLFKLSLCDEKLGESIKVAAIKCLGRVLCIVHEDSKREVVRPMSYSPDDFRNLLNSVNFPSDEQMPSNLFENNAAIKNSKERIAESLENQQRLGRDEKWFAATARRLRSFFNQMAILRSNTSCRIRKEYAQMCCLLIQHCSLNMKHNFVILMESVIALSEDLEDQAIRKMCSDVLWKLQNIKLCFSTEQLFDESAEQLFDDHLVKLPRIINRCDSEEQLAELLFFQGFLRSTSSDKLLVIFAVAKNLEMFCLCLVSAVDLLASRSLLCEEYTLRQLGNNEALEYVEVCKLPWRQFKHLNSAQCIESIKQICYILGQTPHVNRILFDFLMDMLHSQSQAMNEILLILLLLTTAPYDKTAQTSNEADKAKNRSRVELLELFVEEVLNDQHWYLALEPEQSYRMKINKATDWYIDRTPGLYESAIEIRKQDCDSDDDEVNDIKNNIISLSDVQYNILHTCITLDAIGHCAKFIGERFDRYMFRSLHKVLLKASCSNTMVNKAATFALISIQKALRFAKLSHLIETHTDYITYHLNTILRKSNESLAAVDILTTALQFSNRKSLPHLDSILRTIQLECSKEYQKENINSYLKVFNAFLQHVKQWQVNCDQEINDMDMKLDCPTDAAKYNEDALISGWLEILNKESLYDFSHCHDGNQAATAAEANADESSAMEEPTDDQETAVVLPQHIETIKSIITQVLKFISFEKKSTQILALECLISGLPLLKDYENEFMPLAHLVWKPLVEKFRQQDAIVLNRCFDVLNVLAEYAKEFVLKRSLDDVIPFLKQFLRKCAANCTQDVTSQEYKLQYKLLQEFADLIQNMTIENKHFYEISDVVSLYLEQKQSKDLQQLAVNFFIKLQHYNAPFLYSIILKKAYLLPYKSNCDIVLKSYGMNLLTT